MTSTIRYLTCFLVLILPISGQTGTTPPPGHPEVFLAFLRYNDFLSREITAVKSTDANTGALMQRAAAERIGLSVTQFGILLEIYANLKTKLDKMDNTAIGYIQERTNSGQSVEPARLNGFQQARVQAIEDDRASLRSILPDAKWRTLSANIEGDFRQHITRRRAQ